MDGRHAELTDHQIVRQYSCMTDDMHISVSPAPLRRAIEMRLRTAIVEGRFKPGDRLIEREMCQLLGVSRASLREALRQLEAEELVTIVPHRGPVVSELTVAEARQLYDVRAMLEGLAARRFAEVATDDDIVALRQALKAFSDVVRGKSTVPLLTAKAGFYEALLDRCGNRIVGRILTQLNNRVALLRSTSMSQKGRLKNTLAEVTRIVEAIERRDPDGAWQATVDHIARAAEVAIQVLSRQHEKDLGRSGDAGATARAG
ncbi:MAG: GntR family transcriptional regulator [Reyranella sp.]|uniref:GntR family transcriptional regulator n=1 Tax=Reyranella sp. TaxID=1929291 RepID=UPI003D134953